MSGFPQTKLSLGVDIGNVIINHRGTNKDDETLHEERYSTIPAAAGSLESLNELNKLFGGRVYLISKCTPWAQDKILQWLDDNGFYGKTGINPQNVFFVRERHEKDVICRRSAITHFVDDRLEVLSHMIESTPHLYLFQPDESEVAEFSQFLPKVTRVESWKEVVDKIKTSL